MIKNASIQTLNIEHLAQVQNLQNKIFENLHRDEKHFILKRSAEDFIKALTSESTHMLGVFDDDKLIAQCIFSLPQNGSQRDMSEFASEQSNDELVIYKAVAVDPNYRGTNLMKKMLDHIEETSAQNGRTTSIIQIAIDNPASWISALKNGMSIRKVDKDPEDGAKVLYLQKEFGKLNNLNDPKMAQFHMDIGADIHKEIPALYNRMQYRIGKGFYGVGLEKSAGKYNLLWQQSNENANKSNVQNLQMQNLKNKLGIRTII